MRAIRALYARFRELIHEGARFGAAGLPGPGVGSPGTAAPAVPRGPADQRPAGTLGRAQPACSAIDPARTGTLARTGPLGSMGDSQPYAQKGGLHYRRPVSD